MHLQTLLVALAASLAATAAVPSDDTTAIELPSSLTARACTTGCACEKGIKAGMYCGSCYVGSLSVITKKLYFNHIYQCGSNGSCCDYGFAKDCGYVDGPQRCAQGGPIV